MKYEYFFTFNTVDCFSSYFFTSQNAEFWSNETAGWGHASLSGFQYQNAQNGLASRSQLKLRPLKLFPDPMLCYNWFAARYSQAQQFFFFFRIKCILLKSRTGNSLTLSPSALPLFLLVSLPVTVRH